MGSNNPIPLPPREGPGVGEHWAGLDAPTDAVHRDGEKESFERADARTHPQPLPDREGSQLEKHGL